MAAKDYFTQVRQNMVDGQLLPNQVSSERILYPMMCVPREYFVPENRKESAYLDEEIEVAPGRYVLAPVVLGRLLSLADIQENEKILVVGSATGYSALVLSYLAAHVIAVEEQNELADKARQAVRQFNRANIEIVTAPYTQGYPAGAPYDVVFIDGAVQAIPPVLIEQLREGGRLVTVENVAQRPGVSGLGKAAVMTRSGSSLFKKRGFDASVPLLPGFEYKPSFIF